MDDSVWENASLPADSIGCGIGKETIAGLTNLQEE
jgi:hypothetical protein